MDKRTVLFIVALSLALFLVNFYFHRQYESELKDWNQQQSAKKELKLKELNKEIQSHTVSPENLPLVEIFTDKEGKNHFSSGFLDGNYLFTFQQEQKKPSEVYIKDHEILSPFRLNDKSVLPSSLLVYQKTADSSAKVGELPNFGEYDVQLVSFNPARVLLGRFAQEQLTILSEKAHGLEKEIYPNKSHKDLELPPQLLVLIKAQGEWLPSAIYDTATKKLTFLNRLEALNTEKITSLGKTQPAQKTEEQFYVLENQYQQLVFSNFGGALKEINLPFKTKKDEASAVREIEYDRDMVKNHPQNALFPAHPYFTPGETKTGPYIRHGQGTLGGYYPLIRRDLIQDAKYKSVRIPPRYYAANIVSEFPEVAELVYEVASFTHNEIVFESVGSHRKITKIYSIEEEEKGGPYTIDLTVKIEGDSRGLWLTSGVPEVEWISGGPAPAMKYRITRNNKPDVETVELPTDAITVSTITPDWLCDSNGFFGIILDSLVDSPPGYRAQFIPGTEVPSRLVEIEQEYQVFDASKMPGYMMMLPLKPGGGTMKFRIFAGPFADGILKKVDKTYSDPSTGYNPDYIACQTFHGWFSFISEPFAKFLFFLMKGFYAMTGSWGFSIILLTVALRLMLYPLNAWSMKSTIKMQQIAPEIKAIQDKYKKDPKKAQMEVVNLYRERGINPVSGCLPLLIQMPFLIGMFDLLKSTFELRGASFIPGWIDNLSAPDVLFKWNYPIFFIGNEFHLLPFLLGAVMYLQQRMMSPAPADANEMTEQQRQQRAMGNMMTVVFTLMFYNFPSGLNIYWLSSMLLGILQQWWTTARMKNAAVLPKVEIKGGKR